MTNRKIVPTRRRGPIRRLRDLSLNDEDMAALRRQGSVCREQRGSATYYKLRFRSEDGRQRVRYLGKDPNTVGCIRRELAVLQFPLRHRRALGQRIAEARHLMRRVKQRSRSALEQLGFQYHGFQIRRFRE